MSWSKRPLKKSERIKKWHFYHIKSGERRRHDKECSLSLNERHWKDVIAKANQSAIHDVLLWDKGGQREAKSYKAAIIPPKYICFEKNITETFKFLDFIRKAGDQSVREQIQSPHTLRDGEIIIDSYVDFSKIEYISTACATILASEYQRIARYTKAVPPTVNLPEWNKDVFQTLWEIGFFEIVGLSENDYSLFNENPNTTVKTMRIIDAKDNDDLPLIDEKLKELIQHFEVSETMIGDKKSTSPLICLLCAISEAMTNMIHHAYPDDFVGARHRLKRLWVSATADQNKGNLTIAVYDQGISIPVTYPRKHKSRHVQNFLKKLIKHKSGNYINDAAYIKTAMIFGKSQTDQPNRGQGLAQMYDMLKKVGIGSLSIYSRGGWCIKPTNAKSVSDTEPNSIAGTLIQWSVNLG